MHIKRSIMTKSDKFKDLFFLKALSDSAFRILLSSLFHSITVDGKKSFGSIHV